MSPIEIEIFEEDGDNTLSIHDKYADFNIDVYPESKTFQSRMSLNDDVYYRTEQFDYRINKDPLVVEIRLIERVDEPPQRCAVKDGVVLESDILADRKGLAMSPMTKEFIDGLKKEIEWHEDHTGSPISMYILSKHPEIVPTDDYRRYLRQLSERIKTATFKVEKEIASDPMGLKITDEYEGSGRTIWYPIDVQDSMSDEETKKAIAYKEKIQERLFDEKSSHYVGISEGEFRSGPQILKHIDFFLNKKPVVPKKEDDKISSGIKFGTFIIQWIWFFFLISIALWLLSLVISIIEYSFAFAFFGSGVLAFYYINLNSKKRA